MKKTPCTPLHETKISQSVTDHKLNYASTFKPFAFDDRLAAPSLILASFTVIIWQESPANQDYKIAEQPPITLQLVFSLTTCKELWAGSCLVI